MRKLIVAHRMIPLEPAKLPPLLCLLHLVPPALSRRQRQHLGVQLVTQRHSLVADRLARVVLAPPLVKRPLGQLFVPSRVFKCLVHAPDGIQGVARGQQRPMEGAPNLCRATFVGRGLEELQVFLPQAPRPAVLPDVLQGKLETRFYLLHVVMGHALDIVHVQSIEIDVQAHEQATPEQGLDAGIVAVLDFKLAVLAKIARRRREHLQGVLIDFPQCSDALGSGRLRSHRLYQGIPGD
mmetsp:Transcript_5742/g.16108  ORF Transcript_5742/g.16108 Transcript_5742/m.16108 type:complete len:238 (-) Transcript_5742:117-830(-)